MRGNRVLTQIIKNFARYFYINIQIGEQYEGIETDDNSDIKPLSLKIDNEGIDYKKVLNNCLQYAETMKKTNIIPVTTRRNVVPNIWKEIRKRSEYKRLFHLYARRSKSYVILYMLGYFL